MSNLKCQISNVKCQMSNVKIQMTNINFNVRSKLWDFSISCEWDLNHNQSVKIRLAHQLYIYVQYFYEMCEYLQRTAAWLSSSPKSSTAASSHSSPSASSSASTTPSSWAPPRRRVGQTSSSSSPSPSPSSLPAMSSSPRYSPWLLGQRWCWDWCWRCAWGWPPWPSSSWPPPWAGRC